MRYIWHSHTHLIAVDVLIFIIVKSVVDELSLLAISFLTAMGVAVYNISIPDAGGCQPFIRLRRRRRRHKNKREIKRK